MTGSAMSEYNECVCGRQILPVKQKVFAFLPLRSYGFRFIVQGWLTVYSSISLLFCQQYLLYRYLIWDDRMASGL